MKTTLPGIIIILLAALISSCGIGKSVSEFKDNLKEDVDEIQAEIFPLDTASKRIIVGILEGAATEASKRNIDTLSKRISYGITNFLNDKLKELDTKSVGANFMSGIKQEINDSTFQDSLRLLINGAFSDLRDELSITIDSAFINLTSEENRKRLDSLLGSLLSSTNSDKLGDFLNNALNDKISFSSIADSLRQNLLNEETRDAIDDIFPASIDSILTRTERILTSLEQSSESFWEKHIWTIVLAIASICAISYLFWRLRKKVKAEEINDLLMASINNLEDRSAYDKLTGAIHSSAIGKGVQPSLDKRLKSLGLKDNDAWVQSKR